MKAGIFFIVIALGLFVLSQAAFIVDERQQALVLQLREPVGGVREPGLHWKIPLIQEVRYFDKRILSVDPEPSQMVISSREGTRAQQEKRDQEAAEQGTMGEIVSGEPIVVDSFARYKITDPLQFLKTLRTIDGAAARLESILNDATRTVLGRTTLRELLSQERTEVMHEISARVNRKVREDELGIEIVDVRIIRADLTPELRQSTVRRMISELQERATETRARGSERALEIKSTAEKERQIILAEASRDAQIIKGEGDDEAIRIYARAFNRDPEFYSFVRSLEAYKKTLADEDTRLILSPNSEFFKHFEGKNR